MLNCPNCGHALERKGPKRAPRKAPSAPRESCIAKLFVWQGDRSSLTHAKARSIRHKVMEDCGCADCLLVLNPPLTFAEYSAAGLGIPPEETASLFAPLSGKWLKTKCARCGQPDCHYYDCLNAKEEK